MRAMLMAGLAVAGCSEAAKTIADAIASGGDTAVGAEASLPDTAVEPLKHESESSHGSMLMYDDGSSSSVPRSWLW